LAGQFFTTLGIPGVEEQVRKQRLGRPGRERDALAPRLDAERPEQTNFERRLPLL
jgi:hypothetical protein